MPTLSQQQQVDLLKLSDQLKDPLIIALSDQGALVYVVGGSVRDTLLGRSCHDIDFVVVSASASLMLSQGFTQVGRDFPVFLHPHSGAQFALARVERSLGSGHGDFSFDVNSVVTLEEDLIRRDFTINAMALDSEGVLIDPYGGFADLQSRSLRHISPSFLEDPLRVFRGARFIAQLSSWDFELSAATALIFEQMGRNGGLSNLSAERVWRETELALSADGAADFFAVLAQTSCLHPWFAELCLSAQTIPTQQLASQAPDQSDQSAQPKTAQSLSLGPKPYAINPRVILALKLACSLNSSPKVRFASAMAVLSAGIAANSGRGQPCTRKHSGALVDNPQFEQLNSPSQTLCQRLKVPLCYQRLVQQLDNHLRTLMSLSDHLPAQRQKIANHLLNLLTELGALKDLTAIDPFCDAAYVAATVLSESNQSDPAVPSQPTNSSTTTTQCIESAINQLKQAASLVAKSDYASLNREQPGIFSDKTGAQIGQIIEARRLEMLGNLLRSSLD